MCYQTKITKQKQELERSFQAKITGMDDFVPGPVFKAFDFPKTPVITRDDPELIQLYQWGLVPNWAGSDWNRTYTLNARIETLDQKKSFKNAIENRCLVIVNGFYEWQHIDRNKIKYEIGFSNELFALGGLYENSERGSTYTIVTTQAEGIMRDIHNTKLRMPFAMKGKESMEAWLSGDYPEPDYDFTTLPELYQQPRLF